MSEFFTPFTFVSTIIKIGIVFGVVMTVVAYLSWAERRVSALMQDRRGPNRVGPMGLLQPLADGVKFLFKEDFIPGKANKAVFIIAPGISLVIALTTFAVIPFGRAIALFGYPEVELVIANLNVGVLFIFAIGSLGVYGIVLGGWASNNKYSLLGGLRSSAQMVSYELSLGLAVIGMIMIAGSLRLGDIIQAQSNLFLGFIPAWGIVMQPLGFLIFLISAFAETNRAPFDLPEAESELVAGYHVEYSSMKFAMFFMAEYANVITASALIVIFFTGGWYIPFISGSSSNSVLLSLLEIGWFCAKVGFFLFFFLWVRWTLPRFRYDQLMKLGWKVLLPLSLINILITGIWIAIRY